MKSNQPPSHRKSYQYGRGATNNAAGRFESKITESVDDGWGSLEEELPPLHTTVQVDASRSIIARNQSPDIPFSQSINPYRGCEHGCVYCYARPTHAYLNLSPGLDFESKLFYKPNAAQLLKEELSAKSYQCSPIALGANTDPYQPIERQYRVTRSILQVLSDCHHPVTIVTKGAAIIERDLDLLASLAKRNLVFVYISVTTLDKNLKRKLEPRAASPASRLAIINKLAQANVPVGVLVAPIIPALTDHETENILEATAQAGAISAGYVMLRLPLEVNNLFQEWLNVHEPLKAKHVMSRVHELRNGKNNDARFGTRQSGEGVFATLFRQRFDLACRQHGLNARSLDALDTSCFVPPSGYQMALF
jgi:DNA repair photolyase